VPRYFRVVHVQRRLKRAWIRDRLDRLDRGIWSCPDCQEAVRQNIARLRQNIARR